MIGIIDYKAGNSNSVKNAYDKLGINNKLVNTADGIEEVDAIILPGVGSALETMRSLNEMQLLKSLEKRVRIDKIPYMGICVGMQVLFDFSEEGNVECLGWLKGKVVKYDKNLVRIPQIGWNNINFAKQSILQESVGDGAYFYFVNSYHAIAEYRENILATSIYGNEFVAMVEHENIFGTQCHIEKSGTVGLQILKNFSCIGGMKNAN